MHIYIYICNYVYMCVLYVYIHTWSYIYMIIYAYICISTCHPPMVMVPPSPSWWGYVVRKGEQDVVSDDKIFSIFCIPSRFGHAQGPMLWVMGYDPDLLAKCITHHIPVLNFLVKVLLFLRCCCWNHLAWDLVQQALPHKFFSFEPIPVGCISRLVAIHAPPFIVQWSCQPTIPEASAIRRNLASLEGLQHRLRKLGRHSLPYLKKCISIFCIPWLRRGFRKDFWTHHSNICLTIYNIYIYVNIYTCSYIYILYKHMCGYTLRRKWAAAK